MKRRMLMLALVLCLLLPALTGCGSKVPEAIKNPDNLNTAEDLLNL